MDTSRNKTKIYDLEYDEKMREFTVKIRGVFTRDELQKVIYEMIDREIDLNICPYCHREFGLGHKKDCPYLMP